MTDTLRQPLFDIAHLAAEDVAGLRQNLPPGSRFALMSVTPWAVGLLLVSVLGLALRRHFMRS